MGGLLCIDDGRILLRRCGDEEAIEPGCVDVIGENEEHYAKIVCRGNPPSCTETIMSKGRICITGVKDAFETLFRLVYGVWRSTRGCIDRIDGVRWFRVTLSSRKSRGLIREVTLSRTPYKRSLQLLIEGAGYSIALSADDRDGVDFGINPGVGRSALTPASFDSPAALMSFARDTRRVDRELDKIQPLICRITTPLNGVAALLNVIYTYPYEFEENVDIDGEMVLVERKEEFGGYAHVGCECKGVSLNVFLGEDIVFDNPEMLNASIDVEHALSDMHTVERIIGALDVAVSALSRVAARLMPEVAEELLG